jgi:hypothetical protein
MRLILALLSFLGLGFQSLYLSQSRQYPENTVTWLALMKIILAQAKVLRRSVAESKPRATKSSILRLSPHA